MKLVMTSIVARPHSSARLKAGTSKASPTMSAANSILRERRFADRSSRTSAWFRFLWLIVTSS